MALRHSMRWAIAYKDDFGQTLVRRGYHRPLGADAYTSLGWARVAWTEVKYIVSRSCRAWQRCRVPRPRMLTFRVTRSFQGLLGQFVILEMSILELSKYIRDST